MTTKRLYDKLDRIRADPSGCKDFILCDAKDADMAFGACAPGPDVARSGAWKTREQFLDQVRAIIEQDEVDLMLASVCTMEQIAVVEGRLANSGMATAIRANDASDIWAVRGGGYTAQPSRPFRSANLGAVMARGIADLGLYSITFNNDIEHDLRSLEAFREFRAEAAGLRFKYFLEVFNPNASVGLAPEAVGGFVNDCIVRTLAGLAQAERPLFLKIAYNGPAALEELVAYDSQTVVGILGGSSGTTMDTFKLVHDARRHGARLALFGRKINLAEDPLGLVVLLKAVCAGDLGPTEAVKAYHAALKKKRLAPRRKLADDIVVTEQALR